MAGTGGGTEPRCRSTTTTKMTAITVAVAYCVFLFLLALTGVQGLTVETWAPATSSSLSAIHASPFIDIDVAVTTGDTFAAILYNRSVVTWSHSATVSASIPAAVSAQLYNITQLKASAAGYYVALRNDGAVFGWAQDSDPAMTLADTDAIPDLADEVNAVYANDGGAFLALRSDGTAVAWGNENCGGAQRDITPEVEGVLSDEIGRASCRERV